VTLGSETRAVLVLAAGLSARWRGGNKLLHSWHNKPMVAHVIALGEHASADVRAIVVHRDPEEIAALLDPLRDWNIVENPNAKLGLSSSLTLGLNALAGCTRVLVLLGDMPDVELATIDTLLGTPPTSTTYAVVPTFEGQWGNPVLLFQPAIRDCAGMQGDQGARKLLIAHKSRVICVPTQDQAILRDFDRPEDTFGN
jgi:molybdenum cofactor cytidylyltransferase